MSTLKTAHRLVTLCRQGEFMKAYDELFDKDAVNIEPEGSPGETVTKGLDNLKKKSEQFSKDMEELHELEISEPIVSDDHFSCTMMLDATFKNYGRNKSSEVCVYEVSEDGKILKEQFFYRPES